MSALALDGVWKARGRGPQRVEALRGVTLSLGPGELVVLDGPSGSGKTTLLALAGGLLAPDAGSVRLERTLLGNLSPAERRRLRARRIGFVFQHANLLTALTVGQNVRLAAALAGLAPREAERATAELLAELGIADLSQRLPDTLSGGQEMRAAVARALVHAPALVLADEPSASLDGTSALAVAEALARLARKRGTSVLVATHDARLHSFASRRIGLLDGKIADVDRHV